MAKKARKAKVAGKKKTAKKKAVTRKKVPPKKPSASKAKKTAKKARKGKARPGPVVGPAMNITTAGSTSLPAVLTKPAVAPGGINAKRTAVNRCFVRALDDNYPHWNDDGGGLGRNMGDDLNIGVNEMQALLDIVRDCLAPSYVLNTNDSDYVEACVAATVSGAISLTIRQIP
jgi:hypothetical protein